MRIRLTRPLRLQKDSLRVLSSDALALAVGGRPYDDGTESKYTPCPDFYSFLYCPLPKSAGCTTFPPYP